MNANIDELLTQASQRRASDVHITVGLPPQFRVEGVWYSAGEPPLTPDDCRTLALALLGSGRMHRFVQTHEVDCSYSIKGVGNFRVNCFFQRGSIGVAIRLLPAETPQFEDLGLPVGLMESLANLPHGLILVCGPTGSGKSTTLAAMLGHINRKRNAHIITIEDPIEYTYTHDQSIVNQREVGADTESFAAAMKYALRQQPDVIMVGEIRDIETVRAALMLAETGHLVMSTIHTGEVTQGLSRLVDMFPSEQQAEIRVSLSLVLRAMIVQQLLPPSQEEMRRVLATEILLSNTAVQNLIRTGKFEQLYGLLQTHRAEGMRTMNMSLFELWQAGRITREVAISKSTKPAELDALISGHSGASRRTLAGSQD